MIFLSKMYSLCLCKEKKSAEQINRLLTPFHGPVFMCESAQGAQTNTAVWLKPKCLKGIITAIKFGGLFRKPFLHLLCLLKGPGFAFYVGLLVN